MAAWPALVSEQERGWDELQTQRARRELSRLFAEQGIPGELQGDLFHFGFGNLIGRVEVLKSAHATNAHLHMTLSSPMLAAPVVDCWTGLGDGPAAALEDGLLQWVTGQYLAYHDAFAHDDEPTFELDIAGACFHGFEAPVTGLGAEGDVLDRIVAAGPTPQLVASPGMPSLSPVAHRLRWVVGGPSDDMTVEVMLDDEPMPELCDWLRGFPWPEPRPAVLRHSAVLLPHDFSAARQSFNFSLDDEHGSLEHAGGLVEAGDERRLLAALQHNLELEPLHPKAPAQCLRFGQLARRFWSTDMDPLDLALSRCLLGAYAAMSGGDPTQALELLRSASPRLPELAQREPDHVKHLAALFAEQALPVRRDAIINGLRQAQLGGSAVVRMASSSLEAPSAVAAFKDLLPEAEVSFGATPGFDPRLPQTDDAVVLWSYALPGMMNRWRGRLGELARPAVPAPAPAVASAIAALAAQSYSRLSWSREAARLASSYGQAEIEQLLAVMVHPPRLPGLEPYDSRFAVMTAAAFTIGQLVGSSVDGSVAGEALLGLLDGPVDWTTTAAVLALGELALRRSELEIEIAGQLTQRLTRPMSPVWYQCYVEPVAWWLLRLPQQTPQQEELALQMLAP